MQDRQNNSKRTAMLSLEQQQEVLSKSEQLLANFQKLDSEIKFSSKELQNQLTEIDLKLNEWANAKDLVKDTLEASLTKLSRETLVLTALPEKLGKYLNQIIPDISSEIQKQTYQNFDASIKNASDAIDRLNEKIQTTSRSMLEMSHQAFKKKLLTFALIFSVTILGSTVLTYSIMQLFPKTVIIDTKGDIRIEGGNVSVWGAGKKSVQSGQRAKN